MINKIHRAVVIGSGIMGAGISTHRDFVDIQVYIVSQAGPQDTRPELEKTSQRNLLNVSGFKSRDV